MIIAGVIIIIIIIIIIVAGEVESNNPNSGAGTSQEGCRQCELDRAWYNGLPGWKKVLYAVWWATRQALCAMRGC